MSELIHLLHRLGGVATSTELVTRVGRPALDGAVARGTVLRVARGRYALPTADDARTAAHRLGAVVALRSAAASYGWSLKTQPERPEVIVPRGRRVPGSEQEACRVMWRRLTDADRAGWRTSPVRTVLDAATTLPFDEALAIADSALRAGDLTSVQLWRGADALPGRGRDAALEVAWHARAAPANAFESVIRAVSLDVAGLRLVPQQWLQVAGERVRPDLVDRELHIVVEGDSHEFHTSSRAIDGDCWRYDELTLAGWFVIRVSWLQAMFRQDWVRSVLVRAVRRQDLALGSDRERLGPARLPTTVGRRNTA
jgi:hypothetical protein